MLDSHNTDLMLTVAIEAATAAGAIAMKNINSTEISIKNNDEIVTQIDLLCQNIIIDHIKKSFPNDGFLAEEGYHGSMLKIQPSAGSNVWWIIDPIDGTNNYSHSLRCFTVSIAAFHNGKPIVGVVYDPNTANAFTASSNTPASLNGKEISVSNEDVTKFASVSIDSHWSKGIPASIVDLFSVVKFRNLGTTALHLAYVSNGAMVASIINTIRLWDIAAGAYIIEKAGGKVTDWTGKSIFPIDVQNYEGEKFPLIATNQKTYDFFSKIIQKL